MNPLVSALILAGSYALGSVSFAYLAAWRLRGVDLRAYGSGNLGATNAGRLLGRNWAVAIYALDFLKGFVPTALVRMFAEEATLGGVGAPPVAVAAGLAAFLGHCYPAWHGFRGGKGVATASGLVVALSPFAGAVVTGLFLLSLLAFRMVSLGSVVAAAGLPIAEIAYAGFGDAFGPRARWTTGLFLVLGAWVIGRHRANIARIVAGTEGKIGRASARGGSNGKGGNGNETAKD